MKHCKVQQKQRKDIVEYQPIYVLVTPNHNDKIVITSIVMCQGRVRIECFDASTDSKIHASNQKHYAKYIPLAIVSDMTRNIVPNPVLVDIKQFHHASIRQKSTKYASNLCQRHAWFFLGSASTTAFCSSNRPCLHA